MNVVLYDRVANNDKEPKMAQKKQTEERQKVTREEDS